MAKSNRPRYLRVMVDTGVLVAGLVWPRWPYEVLRHALKEDFRLVLAPVIVGETRRIIHQKFPGYIPHVEDFFRRWPYDLYPDPTQADVMANQGLMRDLNDIPLALAAINAQVDCFVSEDKHFTDRNTDTVELHRQLEIMLSGTFLRNHMAWTSSDLEAVRKRSWQELEASEQSGE